MYVAAAVNSSVKVGLFTLSRPQQLSHFTSMLYIEYIKQCTLCTCNVHEMLSELWLRCIFSSTWKCSWLWSCAKYWCYCVCVCMFAADHGTGWAGSEEIGGQSKTAAEPTRPWGPANADFRREPGIIVQHMWQNCKRAAFVTFVSPLKLYTLYILCEDAIMSESARCMLRVYYFPIVQTRWPSG